MRGLFASLSMALLLASAPAQAVTFTSYFDASVTTAQKAVINSALGYYSSTFTNPVNIRLQFITDPKGSNGAANSSSLYLASSASVLSALQANAPASPFLAAALPNFSAGNVASQMLLTSANCRALGGTCAGTLSGKGSVTATGLDAIVWIGISAYTSTNATKHEVNELLGAGGWGTALGVGTVINGQSTIGMLDPWRYGAANKKSLTASKTAKAYLSVDKGVTSIAGYNQSGTGDYGDLLKAPGYVQSWQVCSNPAAQSLTSPEGKMLQLVGYSPLAGVGAGVAAAGTLADARGVTLVPEPAQWLLLVLGFGLAGAMQRRGLRRVRQTA